MNALAGRRWALIVAPVVAGSLTIVGVIADPAPGAEGRELVEAYAADPDALNLPGNVLLTVAFAVLAAALTRIDPAVWQSPATLPATRAASP